MNDHTSRFVFAALCCIGIVAIGCGAGWEILRQKRGATISRRHFRWRLVSAALWIVILACLGYATLFLWPVGPNRLLLGRKFIAVVAGSMTLMLIGFGLMIFDFYLTSKTRQIQTTRMEWELGELARQEIEEAKRARAQNAASDENQAVERLEP